MNEKNRKCEALGRSQNVGTVSYIENLMSHLSGNHEVVLLGRDLREEYHSIFNSSKLPNSIGQLRREHDRYASPCSRSSPTLIAISPHLDSVIHGRSISHRERGGLLHSIL